jgi:predicted nucleotidyltransferase
METQEKTNERIIKILAKEPLSEHTATSIAKTLEISRQGIWKTLNKLSKDKIISLKSIAETKKSAVNITLNFKNPITPKMISILLEKETLNYERWRDNFEELQNHCKFVLLFGSILHNPKEANDIDLLAIVKEKKDFNALDESILKIQKTQIKKIHMIDLTEEEFKKELEKNKNKAYLDALKKGVILSGHDDYVKFSKELNQK